MQWKWGAFFKNTPHVPGHWFWGHIRITTPDELITVVTRLLEQAGSTVLAVWMPPGYAPFLGVADADAFKQVMSQKNTPKGLTMRFFERGNNLFDRLGSGWLGTGLLTSNGDLWKSRRDLLTPSFHFTILQNYMQVFQSRTAILIDRMTQLSQKPSESHDIFPLCTDCTLDIIGACAFGQDLKCQVQKEPSDYVKAIRSITEMVFRRIFSPIYQSPIAFSVSPAGWKFGKLVRTVHELPERLIRERRAYIEAHPGELDQKRRLDFLDLLLTIVDEEGNGLSDLAIRNEVDTFLFEGHDTTAAALSWTLYCLAANPEYQRRAREEVDRVLADHDAPTYEEAKNGFEFLELIIKESLRLFPPVPFIVRNSTEDLDLSGHKVPRGTEMILLIYAIQRSARYWEDPDTFRPERFVEEGIKHPFAYVPFSAGHRSCIGQVFAMLEEKTIISMLLKNFEFTLDTSVPIDPETYIILRPRHGVKLFITRRKK